MFVSLLTYSRRLTADDPLYQAHRAFVEARTGDGSILCAGPRVGEEGGGLILAYGDDEHAVRALLDADPYVVDGLATYELIQFSVGLADPASSLAPA